MKENILIYCYDQEHILGEFKELISLPHVKVVSCFLDFLLEVSNPIYMKRIFIDDGFHDLKELALYLMRNALSVQLITADLKRKWTFQDVCRMYKRGKLSVAQQEAGAFFVFLDDHHHLKKVYGREINYIYQMQGLYYIYSKQGLIRTCDPHFTSRLHCLENDGFICFNDKAYLNMKMLEESQVTYP